jgi:hypothetical protein
VDYTCQVHRRGTLSANMMHATYVDSVYIEQVIHMIIRNVKHLQVLSVQLDGEEIPTRPTKFGAKFDSQAWGVKPSTITHVVDGLGVRGGVYLRPQKMLRKDNRLGENPAILFRSYKLFRSCSRADSNMNQQVAIRIV